METLRLTAVSERLLQILKGNGGWMYRTDLSAAYGRTLGHNDFAGLDDLEEAGLIEIEKEIIGQVKPKFKYRAK